MQACMQVHMYACITYILMHMHMYIHINILRSVQTNITAVNTRCLSCQLNYTPEWPNTTEHLSHADSALERFCDSQKLQTAHKDFVDFIVIL